LPNCGLWGVCVNGIQLGSLEGSTSSSDEGEYDTKDGDSLDEFLQGPSTETATSSDEKRKQVKAKVRSLPDLASSNLFAYLNGVHDDFKITTKPVVNQEGVVVSSFIIANNESSTNSSCTVALAFRTRNSICVDASMYFQVF